MPLKELHAAVPQEQAIELIAEASTFVQGYLFEHALSIELQYRPEVAVHAVLPQRHGPSLDTVSSVLVQVGTLMQRHVYLEEHDPVVVALGV